MLVKTKLYGVFKQVHLHAVELSTCTHRYGMPEQHVQEHCCMHVGTTLGIERGMGVAACRWVFFMFYGFKRFTFTCLCVCVHNAVSVCVCAFAYISLRCMSVLQSHLWDY